MSDDDLIIPDPPPGFKGGTYWQGQWKRTPLRYRLFWRLYWRKLFGHRPVRVSCSHDQCEPGNPCPACAMLEQGGP